MPREIVLVVYRRDGGRCRLCGKTSTLHVHHVRYRSERRPDPHNERNLMVLCSRCHGRVHENKRFWQPVLLEVLDEWYSNGRSFTILEFLRQRGLTPPVSR